MLFKKSVMTAAVFAVGSFAVMSANAAESGTFDVNMTVTKTCNVVAGSTVGLGNTVAGTSDQSNLTSTPVKVNCSNTTPYKLGLTTNTGIAGAGVMLGGVGGTEQISYEMFSNAGHTALWGNNAVAESENRVPGTGDGMATTAKEHIVYIKAGSTSNVSPSLYKDTITVNVSY
ncbi:Csu type fimbrial protein [Psychrobacter cryohalolentis]|uniref:Signal peptide protein n=1 Tax=Psychrobacter cryohalolentis (strain ATCC BAA-1226 / DSM 17306 / VKM B-2378 / K5) TaxID=335284 RepID=Q1Q9P7_PSYCK|nr:spore coat U domain-containing protein [Psychrobacter cryohalolentis]ABE75606.1 putative signal peptide protein [Psychrobacter cryohalolentis K5]ASE25796.1 SCPU domain-containing protein [Psychrobacter cryohalolentis]